MAQRIVIDPVTRIEGHLRIDCDIENRKVVNAWSSGQMWRGIELILKNRDPREAWIFAQRICGVCTTVHAIASVRAVENAFNLAVPLNGQYIRNMIIGAHGIGDHIIHFYNLCLFDWLDIVSALQADPNKAAALASSSYDWSDSTNKIKAAKDKLKSFVSSGKLGIFRSGYWGHPAMKLSPEMNLLFFVHYLDALKYQQLSGQIVAILGGKTPHIQNLAVGGVVNAVHPDNPAGLTVERLYYLWNLIEEVGAFVNKVFLVDAVLLCSSYKDWTQYGAGVTNYLAVPEFPRDTTGTSFELPGGSITAGNVSSVAGISSFSDPTFCDGLGEGIKHAWYEGDWLRHPWDGATVPAYTDFQDNAKYSWIKSPVFNNEPAQTGPLAHVLAMYGAGHAQTRSVVTSVLDGLGTLTGTAFTLAMLQSTIGRIVCRAIRCSILHDVLQKQWVLLMENIGRGDYLTCNEPIIPRGERRGFGFHETPRGVLSHWVVIEDGRIKNYQCVGQSTWNIGPRDGSDKRLPCEAALIDQAVADPEKPLEVLRTVHSFDPCVACAVH